MVTVHVVVSMQTSAKGVEREGKEDLVQVEGQALESRESGAHGQGRAQTGMDHGSWIMVSTRRLRAGGRPQSELSMGGRVGGGSEVINLWWWRRRRF